jgi:hypothetical protein
MMGSLEIRSKGNIMASRRAIPFLAVLLAASFLEAAGPSRYKKPYFGATKPGSWAKYTMSMPNFPNSMNLYTRQADEGGEQRLQIRADFTNEGQASTSYTNYRLKKGYSLEKNAMDFGKAVVGMSTAVGDTPATEMTADILANVRKAMPDYSSIVRFVKTETVAGKPCDRYSYTIKHPGQVDSGELWFNETVPFGLVRQTGTTKNAKGKVLSQFEMILTESGSEASPGLETPK